MGDRFSFIRRRVGPPRFVAFVVILLVATALAWTRVDPARALIVGFDLAAFVFLASALSLLRPRDPRRMTEDTRRNDANRGLLLAITVIVTLAVVAAVAVELDRPGRGSIGLVIATLVLAWLFSNSVFALHYAHLHYRGDTPGGLDFPGDADPDYADFVYFAFTIGMTFQTSDVEVTDRRMRAVVVAHSGAAFVFNLGVLAFTINVLGS